jgi:hypothetical protein
MEYLRKVEHGRDGGCSGVLASRMATNQYDVIISFL